MGDTRSGGPGNIGRRVPLLLVGAYAAGGVETTCTRTAFAKIRSRVEGTKLAARTPGV